MVGEMRILALAFAAVIFLSSCVQATSTPEANLFVMCKSFSSAEQAIRPFAKSMTHEQVTIVVTAFTVAKPICQSRIVDVDDPLAAIRVVRAQLNRMIMVKLEITP